METPYEDLTNLGAALTVNFDEEVVLVRASPGWLVLEFPGLNKLVQILPDEICIHPVQSGHLMPAEQVIALEKTSQDNDHLAPVLDLFGGGSNDA